LYLIDFKVFLQCLENKKGLTVAAIALDFRKVFNLGREMVLFKFGSLLKVARSV
jgi:hypothetical protein